MPSFDPSLTFEPLRYRYHGVGDWSGHLPFSRDVIAGLQPALLVELGTHYGESYFGFCQSIREQGCGAKAFAVDTWQGDAQTGHYCADVFEDVDNHNRTYYEEFSKLLRMSFDEARAQFADGTIDLLHIDGFHSYEAVKHDFETWLPKVAPGGIVLFHDIAVYREGFGVSEFWRELQQTFNTFEFVHSSGLGVLRVPGDRGLFGMLDKMFRPGVSTQEIRRYYEMCAESLDYRRARTQSSQWDIVSQLFWRSDLESFSEDRSSRAMSTLTLSATVVRLEAAGWRPVSELRLDLTNRAMALRVYRLSLLGKNGEVLWRMSGDDFFSKMRHAGLVAVRGDSDDSLVIALGNDCAVLIPAVGGTEGGSITLEIELCGIPPEAALCELARRLKERPAAPEIPDLIRCLTAAGTLETNNAGCEESLADAEQIEIREAEELRRALSLAEKLVRERDQHLRKYAEAFAEAQRIAVERTREAEELSGALAWAQTLVRERDEHLTKYAAALAEAQQIAGERTHEVDQLSGGLSRAEVLVRERDEHLTKYAAALAEAQRIAGERTREAEELGRAMAWAEKLVWERDEHLTKYAAALAEAQRIAEERTREAESLGAALARVEELVRERDGRLMQHSPALAEAQRIAEDRRREAEELAGAFARVDAVAKANEAELQRTSSALENAQKVATERGHEIERLNGLLKQAGMKFDRIESAMIQTGQVLDATRAELDRVKQSLSWRLSRPVRTLERLGRSLSERS